MVPALNRRETIVVAECLFAIPPNAAVAFDQYPSRVDSTNRHRGPCAHVVVAYFGIDVSHSDHRVASVG